MNAESAPEATLSRQPAGSVAEVFRVFLLLGCTSFGGPVAHIGYFRDAFVVRRNWLDDAAYADLVALCQFLPGPASSQVGMALGLQRAGYGGMLAAWLGFTLPSAILMVAFAYGIGFVGDVEGAGWIVGLKAAVVAVVAQALIGMATTLTPDRERAAIAAAAMIVVLVGASAPWQVASILLGGAAGLLWLSRDAIPADADSTLPVPVSTPAAIAALVVFAILLVALPLLSAWTQVPGVQMADIFYRAGALVFGGGHVVLPLLEAGTVGSGRVAPEIFLAGYGAAQAVPGPLFTFAAFLGAAHAAPPHGIPGALIALIMVFLPSALLVMGALPFWSRLRTSPRARRALAGVNAAVVGLLAAALYDPVFVDGIGSPAAMAVAAASFVALVAWKLPAWAVVLAAGIAGQLFL